MEPRISLITLGVSNLERSVHFYRDGLGWPTSYEPGQGVAFFKTWGSVFALYPLEEMAKEIPDGSFTPQAGACGITLAHNCRERQDVDTVMAQAIAAGGQLRKAASDTFWGGYSGYFSDPDGYVWEIAWGAFPIGEDGHLILP
ncbi:VOC family protein [uncultured Cohaesibacter sp.]|uniref:VOC family protein n=1 Tax=uncultured Cohaesibacter sp. TaxID=1002546 RepID=UPI0029C7BD0C|nr:VOC family protein [uncultured Cohaesibacter sp.]